MGIGLVFKFFTSKLGAYSLIVLVILFAGWRFESHIKSVQKAADKEQSDKVEAKLTEKINGLQKQIADQQQANEQAIKDLKAANDVTVHNLQTDLDAERAKKQKVQVVTREVTKYVTTKADSECTITTGFVWLHNVSIRENASLADSPPGTPDTATALKISDVANTVRDNYAECEERGVIIQAWQKWYIESKQSYDKALETEHAGVSRVSSFNRGNYISYQTPPSGAEFATSRTESRDRGKDLLAETTFSLF